MSLREAFHLIGAIAAILVLWFIVALWVGSLLGRAIRKRDEVDDDHLKFPPGAP